MCLAYVQMGCYAYNYMREWCKNYFDSFISSFNLHSYLFKSVGIKNIFGDLDETILLYT
jgi:hypothetical protein